MSDVGVIINPLAKFHRHHPETSPRLARLVDGLGRCDESQSLTHLEELAHAYKDEGVKLLAISGGDGTGTCILTTFRRVYGDTPLPPVAFLRGGTMNTVSKGLGIRPGRPEQLLGRIVLDLRQGKPLQVVKRGTVDCSGQIGFICGLGVIPGFLKEYYARGRPFPTTLTAFVTVGRVAASALVRGPLARRAGGAIQVRVVADGTPWPRERFLTVAASTVPEIGLGFTPFYRAQEDVHRFHLLGFSCSAARLVMALPTVHRGKPVSPRITTEALAATATITSSSGPVAYTVDGDLFESPMLELSSGPVLDLVLP